MGVGEKFVENDFFKDFGQKWKVRNGAVVFQKIFVKSIRAKHNLSDHAKSSITELG